MITTKLTENYLRENGKSSFVKIWKSIKKETINQFHDQGLDTSRIKSDLHLSMMTNNNLIMVGSNTWDLVENYSIKEIEEINQSVLGAELLRENIDD